jgi:acyl dehydratase
MAFEAMNAFLEAEQVELHRIVHGEQRFTYERPVVEGDVLTATLTVSGLRQIGGNDIISTTSEVTDADGALVCTTGATLVHRGAAAGSDA